MTDNNIDNNRILSVNIVDDNFSKINVVCLGPKYSPYEEMIINLQIDIPIDYPNKPPHIKSLNKIYHSNITYETGAICLDILKDNWRPIYTLLYILMSIQLLLNDPNPESPLNPEAAKLYIESLASKENKYKFYKKVQTMYF